jgi:hypothetical protein
MTVYKSSPLNVRSTLGRSYAGTEQTFSFFNPVPFRGAPVCILFLEIEIWVWGCAMLANFG